MRKEAVFKLKIKCNVKSESAMSSLVHVSSKPNFKFEQRGHKPAKQKQIWILQQTQARLRVWIWEGGCSQTETDLDTSTDPGPGLGFGLGR